MVVRLKMFSWSENIFFRFTVCLRAISKELERFFCGVLKFRIGFNSSAVCGLLAVKNYKTAGSNPVGEIPCLVRDTAISPTGFEQKKILLSGISERVGFRTR